MLRVRLSGVALSRGVKGMNSSVSVEGKLHDRTHFESDVQVHLKQMMCRYENKDI